MEEEVKTKVCSHCGIEFPVTMFHLDSRTKRPRAWCKLCSAEDTKRRYHEKKEKLEKMANENQKPVVASFNDKKNTATLSDGRILKKVESVNKSLSTYQSVELIAELKRRGYIWSDMYMKMKVDWNKIEV